MKVIKLEDLSVGTVFHFGGTSFDKYYHGVHTITEFRGEKSNRLCVCTVTNGVLDIAEYACNSITFDITILSTPHSPQ